jgi:large conductance mechanosensitive channel
MGFIQEFKEFAVKGNTLDMAVGIIIGAAFNKIVTSLVNDIIMPPLGMAINGVDFKDLKIVLKEGVPAAAGPDGTITTPEVAEVAIRWGMFINEIINFLIVAFTVFCMIKFMNKLMTMRPRLPFERAAAPTADAPPKS